MPGALLYAKGQYYKYQNGNPPPNYSELIAKEKEEKNQEKKTKETTKQEQVSTKQVYAQNNKNIIEFISLNLPDLIIYTAKITHL